MGQDRSSTAIDRLCRYKPSHVGGPIHSCGGVDQRTDECFGGRFTGNGHDGVGADPGRDGGPAMTEPAQQAVAPNPERRGPNLLVAAALAMSAEATKIAPDLSNQVAVATQNGAWRILAGTGEPGSAEQVLNTARSRLRPGRERQALIAAGPRSWVVPLVADERVVGCVVLFAEHERPLLVPPVAALTPFADRAAGLLAKVRDRQREAVAERLTAAAMEIPRLIHVARSQREMLSALGTVLEEAIVDCHWAIVLRGPGEQSAKVVAAGGDDLDDERAITSAANRAMNADKLDVRAPGTGDIVAPGTADILAAPLHDGRARPIGALVVRAPGEGGVDEDICGRAIVAICDGVSVGLDLAQHQREARILQACDPDTGCLSGKAFRDATESLADASKLANKSAALLVVHLARNFAIPDGSDVAGQALREFLDDEAEADCLIAKLGSSRYTILAPDRSPREAVALAARVRWRLRTFSAMPVAGAVGIAMMPRNGVTYEALVAAASTVLDEALKSGGDNERIAPLKPPSAPVANVRIDGGRSIAMLNALASMVDQMHFAGTSHSAIVAARTRGLGYSLGISGNALEQLTLAGGLHDIGRALLAPELFSSIAPTKAERSLIQTHVVLGGRLVSNAGFAEAAECIASMHEWWDGSGEPHGRSGSAIPLGARILAVANAFETVVGGHGRGDSGLRAAVTAVIEQRGQAFDPDVVDCLLDSLRLG